MSEMELTEGQLLSQNFGVGGPPAVKEVRPLAVIEAELDMLKHDTQQKERALLSNYIEMGRRLVEAKAQLPHGEWGAWLKKKEYSQSTANNFMLLFREYGDEQQSLWGAQAKSQTFEKLTYSKALRLLAIPDEDEREKFAVENDVEHMSIRELNEALKARNEAEDEARGLRQETERLREELTDQAKVYEAKLTSAGVEADQAKAAEQAAKEALEKQREKAQRLQDALSEANTSAQAAEGEHARLMQELDELRNRPAEADTAAVEAARQATIAEMTEKVDKAKDAKEKAEEKRKAAEESLEAAQKELADLKARGPEIRELTQEEKDALTAEAVERIKAESAEQIHDLKKKLAAADPNVAKLMVLFGNWRKTYEQMMEILDIIAQDDEDQAARLRQGVKAALEQMATS